jgi:hypothetical protein
MKLMSSFYCVCGAVTHEDDEPPGASCVVYTWESFAETERRIAEQVAAFTAVGDEPGRGEWIESYFDIGAMYPTDLPDRKVIEDIVSRELNHDFSAMFHCPACDRLAVYDRPSDRWVFYRPELGGAPPTTTA